MSNEISCNPNLLHVPRYIRGRSIEEVQRELELEEVIKLGSNENLLGPSPLAVEAMQRAAREAHYYPGVEAHDLREQLAAHLGHDLTAENIIVGNGSADVLRSIGWAYIFDGLESIVQLPAFQLYEIVTAMYGGKAIILPMSNTYAYELDAMLAQITDKTRLIFINNPNNPTGLYLTRGQVDDFLERVPPQVIVVFDEAYADFAEAADFPNSLEYVQERGNVIVTRTFSKLYGLAGIRVGYGIACPEIIEGLLRTQTAFHVGRVPLLAASAALCDRAHVAKALATNHDGKLYLYEQFAQMDLEYLPTEANFIMLIHLPFPVTAIERAMHKRGLILRPCEPFGLPHALRVTIAPQYENERMIRALRDTLDELARGV
ncbi:MAG TPA: histidinol-phosphate transaminase [Anaerolineae bacterium]|nr:histidinol-phosphate transaminase [Anaerolineae bacterium]